jgi:HAE1 family hydrophobic/amphiphilic exporter-1/multidrug efflux pump
LAKTVAAPVEEQLSGVENMIYFSSSAAADGTVAITATFEVGTDVDKAGLSAEQPRAARAAAPARRSSPQWRHRAETIERHPARDRTAVAQWKTGLRPFLANYATVNLIDELKRVAGVGDVPCSSGSAMRCGSGCSPTRWRGSA